MALTAIETVNDAGVFSAMLAGMRTAPTIIDIEASGFGRGGYPIEIGFVGADGGTYCTLIYPAPSWTHWDASAEAVHGISREILLAHGRPIVQIAREINGQLAGQTVYSDGWANDYAWLHCLFDAADMTPAFRLENLRRLLSDEEAARWHASKALVLAELGQSRHRASADARLLQLTLLRVWGGD